MDFQSALKKAIEDKVMIELPGKYEPFPVSRASDLYVTPEDALRKDWRVIPKEREAVTPEQALREKIYAACIAVFSRSGMKPSESAYKAVADLVLGEIPTPKYMAEAECQNAACGVCENCRRAAMDARETAMERECA